MLGAHEEAVNSKGKGRMLETLPEPSNMNILRLPHEILRIIFLYVRNRKMLEELSHTCVVFNVCVTPILYREIKFHTTLSWAQFMQTISRSSNSRPFPNFIQVIDLSGSPPAETTTSNTEQSPVRAVIQQSHYSCTMRGEKTNILLFFRNLYSVDSAVLGLESFRWCLVPHKNANVVGSASSQYAFCRRRFSDMVASSQKPEVTRDLGSEWTNTWSNYADLLDYNVVSVGPPVLQQQAQAQARFLWQNSRDMYEQVEQVLAAANSSADNETPAGNMLSEIFNSFRPAPTWRSTQLQPLGSAFPMDDGNAPRESSTQVSGTSQSRNTVSSETDFEEFLSAEWSLDTSTFSPVLDKNTMGSNTQAQRIAQRIATLGAQQDQELPRISLKPKHIRPKVISVGSLMELANLCQNLKSLNLAFSHVTPDTYIVETGEYASTIYHSSYVGLTLRKVTAADALAELIRKCVGLVNLDLTGCSWVTSDVVNAAVTANGSLRALNLMECPHLPLPLQKLFIVNEAFELKDLVLQASG